MVNMKILVTIVLVGYDWNIGDFSLGFYYYDFEADSAGSMTDDDGAYVSLSRSF